MSEEIFTLPAISVEHETCEDTCEPHTLPGIQVETPCCDDDDGDGNPGGDGGADDDTELLVTEDYPWIGFTRLEYTKQYIADPLWTYPTQFIIKIDNNWEFVGTPNNLTNLVSLLNAPLGWGAFSETGGVITVVGHHNYGELKPLTGTEVSLTGKISISMASPVAVTPFVGMSTRRMSSEIERNTDPVFLNLMTPVGWHHLDPWPDPHCHWNHVVPGGGGDGPNYSLLEIISMGKTLQNTQDGIGAVTYSYDWFLDLADTCFELGITKAVVAINILSLLIQQIKTYDYTFISGTTASDPGSGNFKLNGVIPLSPVTEIYISQNDGAAADISARLAGWQTITLYEIADVTKFGIYEISNIVDNGTWFTLTVTQIGSGTTHTSGFTNLDAIKIVSVLEANPDPVNVNAINYTAAFAEWDFIISHLASKGVTVTVVQFGLENGIGNLKPAVHSVADVTNLCAKITADYWVPNHPTILRSTDAVAMDEGDRFGGTGDTYNAGVATLNVGAARQYFHFQPELNTYQKNRDRIAEYPAIADLFESVFAGKQMIITQCPCKGGHIYRNNVGEGMIFSELVMMVERQNRERKVRVTNPLAFDLVPSMNFYDLGRLVSGDSSTIYPAYYFMEHLQDMLDNDGAVTGTFSDVDQSGSLVCEFRKRGLTAEGYIINPTLFPILVSTIEVNGVAKNVHVESWHEEDLTADTVNHYLVTLGTSVLLQPMSRTKFRTL